MSNWMKDAVKRPGALRKKAKAAGMSTMAFARSHDQGGSRTAKQSRLAEIFARYRKKGSGGSGKLAGRITEQRASGAFGRQQTA